MRRIKKKKDELIGDYLIFTPYITNPRTGQRIWHPTGGVFVFPGTRPRKR